MLEGIGFFITMSDRWWAILKIFTGTVICRLNRSPRGESEWRSLQRREEHIPEHTAPMGRLWLHAITRTGCQWLTWVPAGSLSKLNRLCRSGKKYRYFSHYMRVNCQANLMVKLSGPTITAAASGLIGNPQKRITNRIYLQFNLTLRC